MHPEIEKLIDLAIADGQITEKERNVILKKAAEFVVDLDEVEMILDGKLHQLEANKPKEKEKVGNIKTCPACGASVKAFQIKCDDCGHEYNKKVGPEIIKDFGLGYKSVNKTFKGASFNCFNCKKTNIILVELIKDEVVKCFNCRASNIIDDAFKIENIKDKINYISSFNIPHDKEGVLSILFYFFNEANKNIVDFDDDLENKEAIKEAFKSKFLETFEIAKILLINDTDVFNQINQMKADLYKNEKTKVKNKLYEEIGIYILAAIIIIAVALMIIFNK